MKTHTIERLIPEYVASDDITGQKTLELHLERYKFAAKHVQPGRLLDIACGVGYGTSLMVESESSIAQAVGVDLSSETIDYARKHYATDPRIRFDVGDALSFVDKQGFDTIVSIETIEHIPDPMALIKHLVALLRPGGVIIASAPTTPSADVNLYHLHDFTEGSFRKMFNSYSLSEVASLRQIQPYSLWATLRREEQRMNDIRQNMLSYYLTHPPALIKRLYSTARYGFTNRYLTVVWQRNR